MSTLSIEQLREYFKRTPLFTYANPKTIKGETKGYRTAILYLRPYKSSGLGNLCPLASKGCIASCLNTAGRGRFTAIQEARQRKTELFYKDRDFFLAKLQGEIAKHVRYCKRRGFLPAVRLNGTSDFPWEMYRSQLMDIFPEVQFYDYTKIASRITAPKNPLPSNYRLVYSLHEGTTSKQIALGVLQSGGNVAVVFSSANYPARFLRYRTVNGDETDLIFLQPRKTIIALYAKGPAKKDTSGFVVQLGK